MLLAAVLLIARAPAQADSPRPTNLVIVTIDTLRVDRLSFYGYERATSPNLDRLFAAGATFSEARTVEPLTAPALASMVTSTHPHVHGANRNGLRMHQGLASLPKALQAHGFRTVAFVGSWTLRDKLSGLAEHFERYEEVLNRKRWFGLIRSEATAEDLTARSLEWIADHRKRHADRPFMLWVHYVEPHAPYRAQDDYLEQLGLTPGDLSRGDRYDSEIAAADAAVGQLLAGLEAQGLSGRTLVAFAADHGESLGEHDYWGHGRHLYEPTLRIPMSLTLKGRIPARKVDAPALIIDLAPTVLSLLGIEIPSDFRGFDWTDVLAGDAPPTDRVTRYQAHRGAVTSNHDSEMAREKGLLEVGMVHHGRKEIFRIDKGRRQIYDLAGDPLELADRAGPKEYPSEGLLEWLRTIYDGLIAFDDTVNAIDAESVEQLRALGYVD